MTREQLSRLSNRELAEEFDRVITIYQKNYNAQESFGVKLITTIGRWSTRGGSIRMIRERLDCGALTRDELITKIQEVELGII